MRIQVAEPTMKQTEINRSQITTLIATSGKFWERFNDGVNFGITTRHHESVVPAETQNLATLLIYGNVESFRFSKTTLNVTAGLLPADSGPGRVRFNTNASYYVKLFSNLKWNVSFYRDWDNQPPARFSGSDYGSTSGLSWTLRFEMIGVKFGRGLSRLQAGQGKPKSKAFRDTIRALSGRSAVW